VTRNVVEALRAKRPQQARQCAHGVIIGGLERHSAPLEVRDSCNFCGLDLRVKGFRANAQRLAKFLCRLRFVIRHVRIVPNLHRSMLRSASRLDLAGISLITSRPTNPLGLATPIFGDDAAFAIRTLVHASGRTAYERPGAPRFTHPRCLPNALRFGAHYASGQLAS